MKTMARFHAREALREWRHARRYQNEARRLCGDISFIDMVSCLIWTPEPKLEDFMRREREHNRKSYT